MITALRAICKLILMVIWFLFMGIFAVVLYWGGWKAIRRISIAAKYWSKVNAKILSMKLHLHGKIPDASGIIISNHQSYLDIVTTSSLFHIRFAPNTEIAKWPVLGQYLSLSRPIWVNRNSRQSAKRTMEEFVETVQNNINLLVFPEGKISDGSSGLQQFKSTTFEAATLGDCNIVPVLLHYRDKDVCWTKWSLPKHLWNVLKMKKVDVDVHFFDPVDTKGMDRKSLAKYVHDIMDSKYRELYS
jgi:1-acyl-sn-glycerol-3-phosphate acyltransferase